MGIMDHVALEGQGRICPSIQAQAEREAQRLRRVLANRESARQTIRRRQALCEVLTRKAADLAWENENLKREKELAVHEFKSLKNANECLKAQVVKAIKIEVESDPTERNSPNIFQVGNKIEEMMEEVPLVEASTSSSAGYPLLVYNQPSSSPFLWPSIIHPPNAVPPQPESSQGRLHPSNTNVSGFPLCILPPPWFFHIPQAKCERQTHPSFLPNDRKDKTNTSNHNNASSSSSSSKTIAHEDDPRPSRSMSIKSEASSWIEAVATSHLQRDSVLNSKAALSGEVAPTDEGGSGKRGVDATAAAEARKRRKELTKLKNLHGRQWRMQC